MKTAETRLYKYRYVYGFIILIFTAITLLRAQETSPLQAFVDYVNSNNHFGVKLFKELHAGIPKKNVVYSPIGISSLIAYLREGAADEVKRNEFNKVFEWNSSQKLGIYHQMFMGRFELGIPQAEWDEYIRSRVDDDDIVNRSSNADSQDVSREQLWMKNSLLYHSSFDIKEFTELLIHAKKSFGMEYVEIAGDKEWESEFSNFPEIPGLTKSERKSREFLLKSTVFLDTGWRGNTFVLYDPKPADFYPSPGTKIMTTTLVSEISSYPYAKTSKFEAVILPANNADFIVILPAKGRNISEIEDLLAHDPKLLTVLKKTKGDVELPQFAFTCNTDFVPLLKKMGMRAAFKLWWDTDIPDYSILGVLQRTSILVDQYGIRAEAKGYLQSIAGGMESVEKPFHMKVNRPFIFQVRDNVTGMLLFMGAVTDPSQK